MGALMAGLNILGSLANAGATVAGAVDSIKTNQKNYNLQVENLAYQKDIQKRIFEREDNAVQRRVADLVSAGLSPTLAAGSSAGAGSVVSTSAPQKKSNFESLMALASVGTALATQQKAITEAENARLSYLQNKMNTDYFRKNGISPIEANMDLSQLLVNKFNRAGNNTLDRILNGVANFFEKNSRSTGVPFSGLPSWSFSNIKPSSLKPYVNKNGVAINRIQLQRLKNYGLLDDFYKGSRSDEVNYIIHKYDKGEPFISTVGDSSKVLWNSILGWFNK